MNCCFCLTPRGLICIEVEEFFGCFTGLCELLCLPDFLAVNFKEVNFCQSCLSQLKKIRALLDDLKAIKEKLSGVREEMKLFFTDDTKALDPDFQLPFLSEPDLKTKALRAEVVKYLRILEEKSREVELNEMEEVNFQEVIEEQEEIVQNILEFNPDEFFQSLEPQSSSVITMIRVTPEPNTQEENKLPCSFNLSICEKLTPVIEIPPNVKPKHKSRKSKTSLMSEELREKLKKEATKKGAIIKLKKLEDMTQSDIKSALTKRIFRGKPILKRTAYSCDLKAYVCDLCGRAFKRSNDWARHKAAVHQPGKFKCRKCQTNFFSIEDFNSHNSTTHSKTNYGGTLTKSVYCEYCFKEIKGGIRNLKHHISTFHVKEGNLKCPFENCGKSFLYYSMLKRHVDSFHLKIPLEKKHKCVWENCGKAFLRERTLQEHVLTHTKEKPFECGECGKKFKTEKLTKTHAEVHRRTKDKVCEDCGKSFKSMQNLYVHKHDVHRKSEGNLNSLKKNN